jgi:hypothetical protein
MVLRRPAAGGVLLSMLAPVLQTFSSARGMYVMYCPGAQRRTRCGTQNASGLRQRSSLSSVLVFLVPVSALFTACFSCIFGAPLLWMLSTSSQARASETFLNVSVGGSLIQIKPPLRANFWLDSS